MIRGGQHDELSPSEPRPDTGTGHEVRQYVPPGQFVCGRPGGFVWLFGRVLMSCVEC